MRQASQSRRAGDRVSALEDALSAESRYIDLYLLFRRRKTGEILLKVGGRWDRLKGEFSDEKVERCHVIEVKEAQVPIVQRFAAWLAKFIAGETRERILLTGGNRRGGKSYIATACLVAIALAVPGAICWMVSPNLGKRDELERYVKDQTLAEWRAYRGMPEYRFTFVNGSTIQSITGDTADALKRGEATAILFNEPQDCPIDVVTYGLPALIDEGGVAIFAGNPARRFKGEWFNNLRQLVIDGTYRAGAFFDVPAAENDSIDQEARQDFGELLRLLDPRAANADDEGLWLPVGERAYPKWSTKLIGEPPAYDVGDITARICHRELFVPYRFIAGGDFQGRPHQAAVIYRLFENKDGAVIFWIVDELVVEGTELHLSDAALDAGYTPENLVWIPDASGSFQDGPHSGNSTSFDLLRSQRWNVVAPTEIRRPDRSRHAKNPDIDRRLGLMYRVMEQARLRVAPKCTWTIASFKECPLGASRYGKKRPYGVHAHITDAACYPVWRLEPKALEPLNIAPEEIESVSFERPGSDFFP